MYCTCDHYCACASYIGQDEKMNKQDSDVKKSLRDALNQIGFCQTLKTMSNIALEMSKDPEFAFNKFHKDQAEAVYHLLKQISECPAIENFSSRYFDAIKDLDANQDLHLYFW